MSTVTDAASREQSTAVITDFRSAGNHRNRNHRAAAEKAARRNNPSSPGAGNNAGRGYGHNNAAATQASKSGVTKEVDANKRRNNNNSGWSQPPAGTAASQRQPAAAAIPMYYDSSANSVMQVGDDIKESFCKEWKQLIQEDVETADYYFNSYSHFGIHEEMLKDRVRTGSYQAAILNNAHLFRGRTVLDVGSGTGILSFFASEAGAAHVYGVECSEIIEVARQIVKDNGLENRITFIKGKAEDIVLPVEKVDIIISEWMGYFLLYESMLDTVLTMRDKWLTPNGLIFPNEASLHIAAIEDEEYRKEKIGCWNDVYGYNFSCIKKCIMEEPIVDVVNQSAICTNSCCVLKLNLNTCTKEELDFCAGYKLQMQRKDFVHALIVWFDFAFAACHKPVAISTSPAAPYTHWKQTVFYLEDVLVANKDEIISGLIAVKKNAKNPRELDIKLSYHFAGACDQIRNRTQFFRLR